MNLKNLILIVGIAIVNFSCNSSLDGTIIGDGNNITSTKDVGSFNAIEIDGVFSVNIIESATEGVEVIGDSNIVANVNVEVNDKLLSIAFNKGVNIKYGDDLIVNISVNNLKKLNINNVGHTNCENLLVCKTLEVKNSSVGKVNLNIEASKLTVENSAVGNLTLSGTTNDLEINNSAVGNIKAYDLKSKTAEIIHTGVGNMEITATKKINIENSGVGNVTYKGNPAKTKHHATSVGDIKAY